MSLPVVFRRAARREFDDAQDWYDRQRPGLGTRFRGEVDAVLAHVASTPAAFAVVYRDAREAPVAVFPYCVYYREHPDRIEVLSVFHTSRDPAVWQSRVGP